MARIISIRNTNINIYPSIGFKDFAIVLFTVAFCRCMAENRNTIIKITVGKPGPSPDKLIGSISFG